MSTAKRLVLIVACIVCLIVAASALPAADPRVEAPGQSGEDSGGWESVAGDGDADSEQTTPTKGTPTPEPDDSDQESRELDVDLGVEGDVYPGNTVNVTQTGLPPDAEPVAVTVEGAEIGMLDARGDLSFRVPETEQITIEAKAVDASTTVDVETSATIDVEGGSVPGGTARVKASIASDPLPGATVYFDGNEVGTTGADGIANVSLPETAGEHDLRIERGIVSGTSEITLEKPEIRVVSGILFPGKKTLIEVTAGGESVEGATVSLADTTKKTNENGMAVFRPPIQDEMTITATVGDEQTSVTRTDIYLKTTAIILFVPGLIIGVIWTYLNLVSKLRTGRRYRRHHYRRDPSSVGDPLAGLGDAFGRLGDDIGRLFSLAGGGSLLAGGFSLPRGMFPSLSLGLPSFGSILPSRDSDPTRSSSWLNPFSDDEAESETTASEGATAEQATAQDEEPVPTEREQLRRAWHGFLDKLGIENRETLTPGEAARQAVTAGYPGRSVRRLLSVFRDVEYGNNDPTPDRIEQARQAIDTLADHDPDEPEEDSS